MNNQQAQKHRPFTKIKMKDVEKSSNLFLGSKVKLFIRGHKAH